MVFAATGGCFLMPVTVTVIEAVALPDFAVIVALPAFTGVTTPFELTVATAVLEELHETELPAGSVVAVSCLVVAPSVMSVV